MDDVPLIVNVESGRPHERGVPSCIECWGTFPVRHDCGGLLHAEFFDESDDSVLFVYACEGCGGHDAPV